MRLFFYLLISLTGICLQAQSKVPVVYATATVEGESVQSSNNLDYAYDDDINSAYHSKWSVSGVPNTLQFYLSNTCSSVSKVIYRPRRLGLNGIFTKVNISYSLANAPTVFIPLPGGNNGEFTWIADNMDKVINLSQPINNPAIFKFEVTQAFGNFTSCGEMEFQGVVIGSGIKTCN
ncbi:MULTISPECIES: hypothetical protein [Flavobacterium]|uniref:F5/8 type C domain protein n=2 Tax=Flavobacterium TaxID=237 RepID=A0A2N9P870_9FLAO|nr:MULTISPECIES: hypothetical protein [Flavobacterium]QYS89576.1 hypothetical protein JJC05_04725 [Flavobacterium davisii]RVU91618.1 hypothetical protein EH230_12285 [Flavobacterium columnare]SPE76535.1 F5/8 type C domain protein [Flavobacterium columnare]